MAAINATALATAVTMNSAQWRRLRAGSMVLSVAAMSARKRTMAPAVEELELEPPTDFPIVPRSALFPSDEPPSDPASLSP